MASSLGGKMIGYPSGHDGAILPNKALWITSYLPQEKFVRDYIS